MKQLLNKKLLLLFLLLLGVALHSQNIENIYIHMPDRLNPTTTAKIRMEMLEYHKAGQGDTIQNRFGGKTILQVFDTLNSRIVVKNTATSTFEMKLMKIEDNLAIGVIRSVCGSICQSLTEFYDTAWTKIPVQFTMPKAIEWLDKNKLDSVVGLDKDWVQKALENNFVSLRFDAATTSIIATNNSADFLSEADRKIIQPLLRNNEIVYQLEGRRWIQKP